MDCLDELQSRLGGNAVEGDDDGAEEELEARIVALVVLRGPRRSIRVPVSIAMGVKFCWVMSHFSAYAACLLVKAFWAASPGV